MQGPRMLLPWGSPGQSQVECVKTEDGGQMTEKADLPLDMAVFCHQSSVLCPPKPYK